MIFWYIPLMTVENPIGQLSPMKESDLHDMLSDGPRCGNWNPTPDEIQEVLAEIHDNLGDCDPTWSSE